MTIQDAIARMSECRKDVSMLVLCKGELFYLPSPSPCGPNDTIYPVTREAALKEAKRLGVPFDEA